MVEKYERQIPDPKIRERFHMVIDAVEWSGNPGEEICAGQQLLDMAEEFNLEYIVRDLNERIIYFLSEEDGRILSKYITSQPF